MTIRPNLQIIYVSNMESSTAFYEKLFDAKPVFANPGYVEFAAGADSSFAICEGTRTPDTSIVRFSEIGIHVKSTEDVDVFFDKWQNELDVKVVQKPTDECYGRTFAVSDPDGHIIRAYSMFSNWTHYEPK
ncbi:VOC family protein [Candidatus Cytomitobacter primus]|uniref:Glyoxalase n=1 Tax=Candidatus Cytomitobacter primus TaxID=2066024 RepID=A0A5C0UFE1_9PROT|nr:VOC family protein [Candidatus Cytomitobacter primus]QEK38778.1 glyoxalase [Candidatus Cytomitobacter primus]